jgi:hypothetical protein
VGNETWGNGATKIVILYKPVSHGRKSNVTTCLKFFKLVGLLYPNGEEFKLYHVTYIWLVKFRILWI